MIKRDPNCSLCRLSESAQYVCLIGQGLEPCDVMVFGEAPGKREEDSGYAFVGKAGQLLRSILNEHGLGDENCFITNVVCCRPPDNRTPTKGEIRACKYWVEQQMKAVDPRYILILGNTPLQSLLDVKGIKKHRGKPIDLDGVIYIPTYHPAAILRDPTLRPALEADIALLREIVDHGSIPKVEGLNPVVVDKTKLVEEMLKDLRGTVSFDIETTCLYPWAKEADITALGFGTRRTQWIVPIHHPRHLCWDESEIESIIQRIGDRLRDCIIVAHNGKFDCLWMRVHYGVEWRLDFDTMLAHYLLNENSPHGLKYLAQIYFGALDYDVPSKELYEIPWGEFCEYLAKDLYFTRKLKFLFGRMLYKQGDVKEAFDYITMPCSAMFTDAEFHGIHIDISKFNEAEEYLRGEIEKANEMLKPYGDENTNWRSTKQLSKILFEELGLTPLDITSKGNPSTNESVLKRLNHPVTKALLKFRGANQQLSFFIEGWKPYLVRRRLHPSFKLHGTVTGRPSCQHPNLQQVPRDSRIRSLITAPHGWELVEVDLSQIELRIAAELSGERNMLDTFYTGQDIHWQTAIREISRAGGQKKLIISTAEKHLGRRVPYSKAIETLFEIGAKKAIEVDEVWKEIRKKAKAINFGFLYGMWWRKFRIYARDNYEVVVTDDEARAAREAYFELFPGLTGWHERQKRYARLNGYVTTLSGRRRRLPAAQLPYDCPERREAERQAINSPVQGFAAELNLMAALQVFEEYSREDLRIVGTVHDSTLFWIRHNKVEQIVPRILKIMSHPKTLDKLNIRLRVPVSAEASIGPWGQGKELSEWVSSK